MNPYKLPDMIAPLVRGTVILLVVSVPAACGKPTAETSNGPHYVAVSPVLKAANGVKILLSGTATSAKDGGSHAYDITIALPESAKTSASKGAPLPVFLPIIHSARTTGAVTAVSDREVRVRLSEQVQELNEQIVQVEVPLKTSNVFRVPLRAIVSPRGTDCFVFAIRAGRAERVAVGVLSAKARAEFTSPELCRRPTCWRCAA